MVEIDYIVDGLEEIMSDERALVEDTNDTVNSSRMVVWDKLVENVVNSVMKDIDRFNVQSRHNILRALADKLSKTQFTSMLVYSRYRGIPYLNDIFVNVSAKIASMSRSGSLNAFCNAFYDKNIDNSVLSCQKRVIKYIEFCLDIRVAMVINETSNENMYRSMYNLFRIFETDLDETLRNVKDSVDFDVMEFSEIGDVINTYGDSPNYTSMLQVTDELCVNSVDQTIYDTVILNIKNYDKIRARSTVFKRVVHQLAITELNIYANDINKLAGETVFEDTNKFAYEYEQQTSDTIIRSLVEHFVDHKKLQLNNMFIDSKLQVERNMGIVMKFINMLMVI